WRQSSSGAPLPGQLQKYGAEAPFYGAEVPRCCSWHPKMVLEHHFDILECQTYSTE
ncbi:hypothetical protein TorRG33x02_169360, partial [Trema orientale]